MSQSREITDRIIDCSSRVGGNPKLVPVAPAFLEIEIADVFYNFCEALETIRVMGTNMNRDDVLELLHCPDIADAYKTWCQMHGEDQL